MWVKNESYCDHKLKICSYVEQCPLLWNIVRKHEDLRQEVGSVLIHTTLSKCRAGYIMLPKIQSTERESCTLAKIAQKLNRLQVKSNISFWGNTIKLNIDNTFSIAFQVEG